MNLPKSLTLCGCLILAGCGQQAKMEEQGVSSQTAYDAGLQAFEAGRYGDAVDKFSLAIDGGGLNADLYCDALIRRAIGRAEIKDFDGAHADLDAIADKAPDLERVYEARARVYLKQENREKAAEEFARAREINPGLPKLAGL